MERFEYYKNLKNKAREIRMQFGLASPKVGLSDLRKIYRFYGIKIDQWKGPLKNVRGSYMNIDGEATVMVSAKLPKEQRIFTLAHELKHHLFDQGENRIDVPKDVCEIGAEIFAVELIFPDSDFESWFSKMNVVKGSCTQQHIVRLKHDSNTTLSYKSLAKRAERLGYAPEGFSKKSGWINISEQLYGEPIHKRIHRYRKRVNSLD